MKRRSFLVSLLIWAGVIYLFCNIKLNAQPTNEYYTIPDNYFNGNIQDMDSTLNPTVDTMYYAPEDSIVEYIYSEAINSAPTNCLTMIYCPMCHDVFVGHQTMPFYIYKDLTNNVKNSGVEGYRLVIDCPNDQATVWAYLLYIYAEEEPHYIYYNEVENTDNSWIDPVDDYEYHR